MNYENVSRVEVIDEDGRSYVKYGIVGMTFDLQDDGRTLKLFLTTEKKQETLEEYEVKFIAFNILNNFYEFKYDYVKTPNADEARRLTYWKYGDTIDILSVKLFTD